VYIQRKIYSGQQIKRWWSCFHAVMLTRIQEALRPRTFPIKDKDKATHKLEYGSRTPILQVAGLQEYLDSCYKIVRKILNACMHVSAWADFESELLELISVSNHVSRCRLFCLPVIGLQSTSVHKSAISVAHSYLAPLIPRT